jgi:predicted Rdx family selenoprotein
MDCATCPLDTASSAAPAAPPGLPAYPFTAPFTPAGPSPSVIIEFCDRCRWLHRAAWVQTELMLTFTPRIGTDAAPTKASGGAELHAVTLVRLTADETAGRFRVWLSWDGGVTCVSDRKADGEFPELKVLVRRRAWLNVRAPAADSLHRLTEATHPRHHCAVVLSRPL